MNSVPIKILYIAISDGLSSSNEYLIIKKDDPQIEDVTRASKKFLKFTGFEAYHKFLLKNNRVTIQQGRRISVVVQTDTKMTLEVLYK